MRLFTYVTVDYMNLVGVIDISVPVYLASQHKLETF